MMPRLRSVGCIRAGTRRASRRLLGGVVVFALIASVGRAQAAAAPTSGAPASQATIGAADVPPLERPITIELVSVPLATALRMISDQADLGLAFTNRSVPSGRRVSLSATRMPAGEAIGRVLEGTGLMVRESPSGQLILVKAESSARSGARPQPASAGLVWGRVTDTATARPLAGVTVSVRGTALGTVTNDSGYYGIQSVPAGRYVLDARFVGYQAAARELTVADSQPVRVDFALQMGMTRLQQVVTTAAGARRRLELGNDVVVIDADSVARTQPVTSVTDLLEGRVPGLVVQRTSGAPGDPARLRLRGASSAHLSNDPIVIVDGVRVYAAQSGRRGTNLASSNFAAPSPLDYMDPHSIETIEVLKGPSAATLYGADAANGVIVITTKRGRAGPPRWTASLDYGTRYLPGRYPDSYLRWGHLPWDGTPIPCRISDARCQADSLVRFQMLNDRELTVLDRGQRMAATVGVSGGTDALTYSLTASGGEEVGLVRLPDFEAARYRASHGVSAPEWMRRPQALTQWGVTGGLTAKLGTKADLALTTQLSRTEQQRSSLEQQLGSLMMTYVDRGTGTYYRFTGPTDLSSLESALTEYYRRVTADATQFTNGVSVNWRPLSWLTAGADAGLNVIQREDAMLLPRGVALASSDSAGEAAAARGTSIVSTVNVRAATAAPLAWGFRLNTAVGVNYQGQQTGDLSVNASDLAAGTGSVGQAGRVGSVASPREESATFGLYVEPSLAHKRFWLSTGLRLDGGNTFGTRAKLTAFPKVSASYLVSDEAFFPLKNVVGMLRLRAAYGHAGVQPGPGDRLRLYSARTNTWADGRFLDAITLQTLGNTELRPERSTELEGGFDTDFLDDRVSVSFTGYRKTRLDALMQFPLPPSVYGQGATILRNVGEIRNTGYTLTLDTRMLRADAVTFGTQLQVSHNQNVVVRLGPGVEPFDAGSGRVAPGYPLFGRWGRPVLGYRDANADGVLAASEVLFGDTAVFLGSPAPDYTASLSPTLSILRGQIAVSASFEYQSGLAQVGPWSQMWQVLRAANDPAAPLAEQALINGGDFLNTQTVDALRFNSLSVTYNAPASLARQVGARALAVALQGTNLGLRTNYRGLDPNVNASPLGDAVRDTGVLPEPRTWQVRVSASY